MVMKFSIFEVVKSSYSHSILTRKLLYIILFCYFIATRKNGKWYKKKDQDHERNIDREEYPFTLNVEGVPIGWNTKVLFSDIETDACSSSGLSSGTSDVNCPDECE